MTPQLDRVDRQLLARLQKDGRITFGALAKEVGLSDAAVHNRVRRLHDRGHIAAIAARLGRESFGYDILACMGFNATVGKVERVAQALAAIPNLYEVWVTTGTHNITARGVFRDHREIQEFTSRVHNIDGIQSYDFGTVVEEAKTEPMIYPALLEDA